MKPVGLVDPRTGRQPFAVVQLRAENLRFSSYNLVGFQNHLKFPEQKRIMRLIPGLENAEFLRLGQIHRNTYINAPRLLNPDLSFRSAPQVFVAGQLSGVEGYVECISTGLLAGMALASRALGEVEGPRSCDSELPGLRAGELPGPSGGRGDPYMPPPRASALGSLVHYITHASSTNYQPGVRSSARERSPILQVGWKRWLVRCPWSVVRCEWSVVRRNYWSRVARPVFQGPRPFSPTALLATSQGHS
jgi:methylenetetrahydrofolate--tRNA-(uracil-5-)-methyltransferase